MNRILAIVLLGLFATVACGGGGGGGGGGVVTNDPASNILAGFIASMPNPGPNTVTLREQSAAGDLVTVRVQVTETSNVYGAAVDLTYDASELEYVDWAAGTFLEQGGQSPNYTVQAAQAGRVVIGVSRTGNAGGASTSGNRPLIYIVFRVTRLGDTTVFIQNGSLADNQFPPQDLSGISWFGGYATGTAP